VIENCRVIDGRWPNYPNPPTGAAINLYTDGLIRNVEIEDYSTGINVNKQGTGMADVQISGCSFVAGTHSFAGVSWGRASGIIEHCQFTGVFLFLDDAGDVVVRDTVIEDADYAGIRIETCGSVELTQNTIRNCDPCVYLGTLYPVSPLLVRGNQFLSHGNGFFVTTFMTGLVAPFHRDFSHNHWGTTDLDEISARIHDGYDDPDVIVFIDFEPIGDVATENRSLSGTRTLFR